ncbi:hypothetical protein NDU88_002354 [Pleurodeles waltl]|uniref:Uncharacterized protein n=1 Tax=Pleurodeles waltl TaxID=8319 RepID=A0AAV7M264_PLEWA|nr:hypothetical protein NDU88_002354 [Pleurodeles waltl]
MRFHVPGLAHDSGTTLVTTYRYCSGQYLRGTDRKHVRLPRDAASQYELPLLDPVVGPVQPCTCRCLLRHGRNRPLHHADFFFARCCCGALLVSAESHPCEVQLDCCRWQWPVFM